MPENGGKEHGALDTCPVCGTDLADLNVKAHHDSHFNLATPVQFWSPASREHSDMLLAEAGRRGQ